MRIERWAFSPAELSNPGDCRSDDELIAAIPHEEFGVIVYRNGTVSNRWEDGVSGVPRDCVDIASEEGLLWHPKTQEDTLCWCNVVASDGGAFVRFATKQNPVKGRNDGCKGCA